MSATSRIGAADWPQWRGPDRNGAVRECPPLLEEFSPKPGLTNLWTSEPILGSGEGGYGSVSVAAGKAYVYVNHSAPVKWRQLTSDRVKSWGYDASMPAELSKAVEDARVSDARKNIKDNKELKPWVDEWIKTNVKEEQKQWKEAARIRLSAGASAMSLDVIARLQPILDRKFDTEAALAEWAKTAGFDEATQKLVLQRMGPTETQRDTEDLVYCLEAATGKTLWKTPLGGQWFYFACSATPTISDGKCYVCNSEARIYCLDAKDGNILWKSDAFGADSFHHNRASSVLVADGVAMAFSERCLAGIDIKDGKTLWTSKDFINQQSTAVAFADAGKTWVMVNASGKLGCLDPKDGKSKWNVTGGGGSTPTLVGQYAAVATGDTNGAIFYKVSPEGAELLAKSPGKDPYACVLISGDYAYTVGGAYQEPGKGKAVCIGIKDGKVVWEETLGAAQLASPILADGKIIAVNGGELVVFKADPAKFTLVGKVNLGLDRWTSPAIADGKLFLRTPRSVICVDLRKAP